MCLLFTRLVSSGHIRPHATPHARRDIEEEDDDLSDEGENDNTASDVKARQKKMEEQEYEEEEKEGNVEGQSGSGVLNSDWLI